MTARSGRQSFRYRDSAIDRMSPLPPQSMPMRLAAPRTLAATLLLAAAAPARAQSPAADSTKDAPRTIEQIPDRWKDDDGLVIGQIGGTSDLGVSTWGGVGLTGVAVNGGWRPLKGKGLFRGFVLFTRGEGQAELARVYAVRGATTMQLPMKREFSTRKGQITVLGLLYFRKTPGVENGYQLFAFDNRDETVDYLRRTYPQLLAGHDGAEVVLAPGKYLGMEKLVAFRTALATYEARHAKRQGQFWLATRAGTIAEVKVVGDSVQLLRFLPPVTYQEPLLNTWDAQGALTFSSGTHRWRVANGAVEELPLPVNQQAARGSK